MPTLRIGAATLTGAGVLAATADPVSSVVLAVALFLLGLGWSLCLVAGNTMLVDAVPLARRPQAQGNADLLVGLAGATGRLGSGFLLGAASFAAVGLFAAVTSVVFLGPRWIRETPVAAEAGG
jgi:MFS family permease